MIANIDSQILLRLRPEPMRGHWLSSFKCEHAIAESRCFIEDCSSSSHVLIFRQGFSSTVFRPSVVFELLEFCLGLYVPWLNMP